MSTPKQRAREQIDRLLAAAGWAVQDFKAADIDAASGVAIRWARCAQRLAASLPAWRRPLPFVYKSTGAAAHFTNGLDLAPRAQRLRFPHAEPSGGFTRRAPAAAAIAPPHNQATRYESRRDPRGAASIALLDR